MYILDLSVLYGLFCMRDSFVNSIQVKEDDGIIFFTSSKSPKVQEISNDSCVSLTGQSSNQWVYVKGVHLFSAGSFLPLWAQRITYTQGTARVIQDKEIIKQYWTEGVRPWFPEGTQECDISIVKIIPQRGEYWDQSSLAGKVYILSLTRIKHTKHTRIQATNTLVFEHTNTLACAACNIF